MKQKKTSKVLERWPFDPGSKSLGPQQGKQVKRLKGATQGEASKEREGGKKTGFCLGEMAGK